jgi:hypothetical protein
MLLQQLHSDIVMAHRRCRNDGSVNTSVELPVIVQRVAFALLGDALPSRLIRINNGDQLDFFE